jgi:rhodanese-related sulfurtransferase
MNMQEIDPTELARMCSIGGTLSPMGTIVDRLDELRRDVPVVVHCKSGARSAAVVQALSARYGFTNLINLQGGITAYAAQVDPQLQCG